MLLDNFPKGFGEGLNWLTGADLSVSPLENHPFWKGCGVGPRDLKIRTKSSIQAHERTYHVYSGLRSHQFILLSQRASVTSIYIYMDLSLL